MILNGRKLLGDANELVDVGMTGHQSLLRFLGSEALYQQRS